MERYPRLRRIVAGENFQLAPWRGALEHDQEGLYREKIGGPPAHHQFVTLIAQRDEIRAGLLEQLIQQRAAARAGLAVDEPDTPLAKVIVLN